MFEDSLLESQNRTISANRRWTTIASLTLQCALAAAALTLPLLHPDSLTFRTDAPRIFLPLQPVPRPPRVTPAESHPAAPSSSPAANSSRPFIFRQFLPHPDSNTADAPPTLNPVSGMGLDSGPVPGSGIADSTTAAHITIAPARPPRSLRVSGGVAAGLLLAPIRPIYPRIAIAMRTEGTVVVEAIISKSGTIESARATSGPATLREAAVEAVRNARYSPYLLNGTPTEVDTTVTVTFRLAS